MKKNKINTSNLDNSINNDPFSNFDVPNGFGFNDDTDFDSALNSIASSINEFKQSMKNSNPANCTSTWTKSITTKTRNPDGSYSTTTQTWSSNNEPTNSNNRFTYSQPPQFPTGVKPSFDIEQPDSNETVKRFKIPKK